MLSPDRQSRFQGHRKSDRCLSSSAGLVLETAVEIGFALDTGVVVGKGRGTHSGLCSAAGWVAAVIAVPSRDRRLARCLAAAPNAVVTAALCHDKHLARYLAAVGDERDFDLVHRWAVDFGADLSPGPGLCLRLEPVLDYETICAVGLSVVDRGIAHCAHAVLDSDSELEIDLSCEAVAVRCLGTGPVHNRTLQTQAASRAVAYAGGS